MRPEGSEVLGRGPASPSPQQLGVMVEHCKLPQRGQGRAPENLGFGAFWELRNHVRTVS